MAQKKTADYVLINENEELGNIALSSQVIELIAKNAITEITDISLEGSLNLFNKKAVTCNFVDNSVNIMVTIKVKYGVDVQKVSRKVQEKIYDALKEMTGIAPSTISVNVDELAL